MTQFDYVIVGAGPAGCVLANRLSANPEVSVLLVEAGDRDDNPLIAMPRGFGQLMADPNTVWHFPTRPFGPAQQPEFWVRGKTLGGSSSVNGMVYNRGSRADWDALADLGNPGWGWDDMVRVFTTIEDNPLGAAEFRGAGGPLRVSTAEGGDPLLEDVITAGTELGWHPSRDLNENDEERIGYATATIRDGQRTSAATAAASSAPSPQTYSFRKHCIASAMASVRRTNGRRGAKKRCAISSRPTASSLPLPWPPNSPAALTASPKWAARSGSGAAGSICRPISSRRPMCAR